VSRPASLTGLRLQRGRWEGGARVMSPGPHWQALTPRPLGGGRGGVEQGAPHSPCYPGPMVGGLERSEGGALETRTLTTNVGWGLDRNS
jgi:hypothetical protein